MSQSSDCCASFSLFRSHLQSAFSVHPRLSDRAEMSQAPAVVDVMGGICEEGGSLVLTATLGISVKVCAWQTADRDLKIRRFETNGEGDPHDFSLTMDRIGKDDPSGELLLAACRRADCEWAAPVCLAAHRALLDGLFPRPQAGLMFLVQSDFPSDADLGLPCATAAAVIDALARLFGATIEPLRKAITAAHCVSPLTVVPRLRMAMTALRGAADGSLLQLRFVPQFSCEPLSLPAGITLTAARTRLQRPTRSHRLRETQLCAEMCNRMILDLRQKDGQPIDARGAHLAAITPTEYVDRYRDRLPSKITGKAFVERFGTLRGLDELSREKEIFKIRSRAEHHIYENRRVHDFVTNIVRAGRMAAPDALIAAGELMYASHWSYSQRCGIGGVETDRLVSAIRRRGSAAGLFGAKITGNGNGGEVVVLMRDDETAHAALQSAVDEAQAASKQPIEVFSGSLAGVEHFQPTQVADLLGAPAAV